MESLQLGENIGEGEFGSVHKAVYMTEDGEERSVAVKVGMLYLLIFAYLEINFIFFIFVILMYCYLLYNKICK